MAYEPVCAWDGPLERLSAALSLEVTIGEKNTLVAQMWKEIIFLPPPSIPDAI